MNTRQPFPACVSGQVLERVTQAPLADVRVRWQVRAPEGDRSKQVLLGEALSDSGGRFTVESAAAPEAEEAHCRLAFRSDVRSYLVVAGQHGVVLAEEEVTAARPRVTLFIAGDGVHIGSTSWKRLADFLISNRMYLARHVIAQLTCPTPDSPVSLWLAAERSAALAASAAALGIAPVGAQAAVADVTTASHFADLDALGRGDLGKALTAFRDRSPFTPDDAEAFGDGHLFGGATAPSRFRFRLFDLRQSDRELYRDYLRGAWATAAARMFGRQLSASEHADLESQLESRFHQDFLTGDESAQPVETLLIPILETILTAPPDQAGFGVAPAAIPSRGNETDAEFLATLIGISGVDAKELRNRYRLAFDRPAGTPTNLIELNVEALLGLLSDTYQSPQEPFAAAPAIEPGRPLIFGSYVGRAPFFLEYEEWLDRQGPFFPENFYQIRRNVPLFSESFKSGIVTAKSWAPSPGLNGGAHFPTNQDGQASGAWVESVYRVSELLLDAFSKIDLNNYADASRVLLEAQDYLGEVARKYQASWFRDTFDWEFQAGGWNPNYLINLHDRARNSVTNADQLAQFEDWFKSPAMPEGYAQTSDAERREMGLARARALFIYGLLYLGYVLIPYLRATIHAAEGEYAQALRFLGLLTGYEIGVGEAGSREGYSNVTGRPSSPDFHKENSLPYTIGVTFDASGRYADQKAPLFDFTTQHPAGISEAGRVAIHPFEQRFFKLAQGEIMLDWADQLYRNDDPASIRRARELYKGVILLHGRDPEIAPHFPPAGTPGHGGPRVPRGALDELGWEVRDNPARMSQLARARLGFQQIELGLNAYGYSNDIVPLLRYRTLKLAADSYALAAKSAQTDFLQYLTRFEEAQIDRWQTAALLKKSEAAEGIAIEQIEIAKDGVVKAEEQVKEIQARIAAKQAEIADKNAFFEQVKDFFGGMQDSLTGLVPLGQRLMSQALAAQTGAQTMFPAHYEALEKSLSGLSLGDSGLGQLGPSFGIMAGYGAFIYASYSSMSAMVAAEEQRGNELRSLLQQALPAAESQLRLRGRDVQIARYHLQIAQADLELARTLWRFQHDRFLSLEFWNKLQKTAQRLMSRYVELGARTGWLAERALAFEQSRTVRVVRLNYTPTALRGITGPDRLQADLAELEASRLQSIRTSLPLKHSISLLRDFPLAYGELKRTGRCRFRTEERQLRRAHPGTFRHRIRAITVAAHDADGPPPRGMLRNSGVSILSGEDEQDRHTLLRFPDALPLSEFRLRDDLAIYGLPGETLLQFEGSAFETDWELIFPLEANLKGLRTLTDVIVTFDINASYSPALAARLTGDPVTEVARTLFMRASIFDRSGLESLSAGPGPARLTFDPRVLPLPFQERSRRLTNLAVMVIGRAAQRYAATMTATTASVTAVFPIDAGVAMSNAGPLLGTNQPLPLNALIGLAVNQPFRLEIDRIGVEDELRALFDIGLFLEYHARV